MTKTRTRKHRHFNPAIIHCLQEICIMIAFGSMYFYIALRLIGIDL